MAGLSDVRFLLLQMAHNEVFQDVDIDINYTKRWVYDLLELNESDASDISSESSVYSDEEDSVYD